MRRWIRLAAPCLLVALLCACGKRSTAPASPPPESLAPVETPQATVQALPTLEGVEAFAQAQMAAEADIDAGAYQIDAECYTLSNGGTFPRAISLTLRYPQISGLAQAAAEPLNLTLFDAALKMLGDEITVANAEDAFRLAAENLEAPTAVASLVAEMDYEVLSYTEEYLSLHFFGFNVAGASRVNMGDYLVTVDLHSGGFLPLSAVADNEKVKAAIKQGNFQVYTGNYLPGGWDETEMRAPFLEAFETCMDKNNLTLWHHYSSDRWESGESVQKISISGREVAYAEYDIYSSKNFAVDEDFLYIWFLFEDSLNGYVILQIPRGAI